MELALNESIFKSADKHSMSQVHPLLVQNKNEHMIQI